MMISSQDSANLLAIFRAAAEGGGWPMMLHRLAAHFQADWARFFTPSGAWDQAGCCADPEPSVLVGLRLGRVYTGEELLDRALGQGRLFQAKDLRAIGLRLCDGVGWLLLARARGSFRAMDSAGLAALAPHVEQAHDLAARMARLEEQARQANRLARRMGVGVVRFDARGGCVEQDATAQALLARAGQSIPALPATTPAIHLLDLPPNLEMLCQPGHDGLVTGFVRAKDTPLPTPEVIAPALGLSLPEARLARSLGMGASLAEASQALGLTLETARYYSKQIYAKTGLRGQSDLMRRLWTSALVLADTGI